jgi:uncharacterized repeat protein (TIGR01451 family)
MNRMLNRAAKATTIRRVQAVSTLLATSLTIVAQQSWLWTPIAQADQANICATPGNDGPVPTGGQVNTFYPGTAASVGIGSTSLVVGTADGSPPIKKGDLLMIIQMQGADIDSTNTDSYGDGSSGNNPNQGATNYPASGVANGNLTTNFTAGLYEYAVAKSDVPLTGGTLDLTSPLINSYSNVDNGTSTSSAGQRRFQVIRVPQYSSSSDAATSVSSTLTAPAWNGVKGGIFAMDVAGILTFASGTIDMSGRGFRGGGGKQYGGDSTNPPLLNTDVVTLSTRKANGSKGEGIAGTPKYLLDGNTASSTLITGTNEGYPDGSFGRGAPGNAGGGGSDGYPQTKINGVAVAPVVAGTGYGNGQNAGGGGGSNGGIGGKGGKTWSSALPYGGDGGSVFPATPTRLIMGGGGGAGSTNDATSTAGPSGALASSGAPGGGIIMVRAAAITGTGSIVSNGQKPVGIPANDASGGGGAGGSILVVTDNGSTAGLTLTANGGAGGNNTGGGSVPAHGPGGGGSGGVIFNSSSTGTASIAVAPGDAGKTAGGSYGGATAGTGTNGSVSASPADTVTMISGANCLLKTTKSTTTPGPLQAPAIASYSITVSNPTGLKRPEARDITIQDVGLPTGFTHTLVPIAPVYAGGATGPTSITATGTTTSPIWTGTASQPLNIPPGGSITLTFNADIATTATPGTYSNSAIASAKYINTNAGSTIVSPYAVTSNYDGNVVTNTADDVTITASSPLNVNKTVALVDDKDGSGGTIALASQTPTPGDVLEYTIVTTNPSSTVTALGIILKDTIPPNTTYVPGSIQVAGVAKTDAVADDAAELTSNQVVARLGTGATTTGGGSLAPTATSTVKFRVTINDPIAPVGTTTVSNQAIVASTGNPNQPSNDPTTPLSGDPTVNKIGPRLRLVKRITGIRKANVAPFNVVSNPIGGYAATITPIAGYINDPTAVNDDPTVPWTGGAATYLQGITKTAELPTGMALAPKDQVEYTIYFLADSTIGAQGVNLCDFVPANQTFVDDSLKLQVGTGVTTNIPNGSGTTGSGLYTSGFPAACAGTNNSTGAAYVQVGTVPTVYGTPTTAYGKFSFLATVK